MVVICLSVKIHILYHAKKNLICKDGQYAKKQLMKSSTKSFTLKLSRNRKDADCITALKSTDVILFIILVAN